MIKLFKKINNIYIMPGKHFRQINTKPLSRKQSIIVKNTLENFYKYENGCRQWNHKKDELVNIINELFVKKNLNPIYTTRKLDDFLSNKLYRDKKKRKETIIEFDNLIEINFTQLNLLPEWTIE